jgi:hypothetical protein
MSLFEASTPDSGERLNIDSTWNNFLMYIKTFITQCLPAVHSLNSTLNYVRNIKLHLDLLHKCFNQQGDEVKVTKISLGASGLGIMWENL